MTFEEWKELPYVKAHWVADDLVLRKIYKDLSHQEMQCMKFDEKYRLKHLTFVCQCCANAYTYSSDKQFEEVGKGDLWKHIEVSHPFLFNDVVGMSDEEMLEECYKH